MAIVNVNLRFADTGVGYGLSQRFTVCRKFPAISLDCLAVQLVSQLDMIVGFAGTDGGAFGHTWARGRVIFAVELEVKMLFVGRVTECIAVFLPFRNLNGERRHDLDRLAFPGADQSGGTVSARQYAFGLTGRSIRSHVLIHRGERFSVLRDSPL